MLVDLNAPYQTYSERLADAPEGVVALSTGMQPWGYAAAVGLGLGGDVSAQTVEVAILTAVEPVYLFMVDNGYHPVGERFVVTPKTAAQLVTLPLGASAYSLVVQSGDRPQMARVTLLSVLLRLV